MFAALIPVGPGQQEVERFRDTLDSLRAFEDSSEVNLVVVDDDRDTARPRQRGRRVGIM